MERAGENIQSQGMRARHARLRARLEQGFGPWSAARPQDARKRTPGQQIAHNRKRRADDASTSG